jgi:ACS family glucarate transporter-like MFS transporter
MASVAGFSVCTMLFYPLGGSLGALIALRLLLGAAESVHMPMNSALVGRWFAPHERGRANSVYVAGILVALAVAPLIVGAAGGAVRLAGDLSAAGRGGDGNQPAARGAVH